MKKSDMNLKNEDKYGFKDKDTSIFNSGLGLNEDKVRLISKMKNEPDWMLQFRLDAYHKFVKMPMPSFGPDLSNLDFDSYTYFTRYGRSEEHTSELQSP